MGLPRSGGGVWRDFPLGEREITIYHCVVRSWFSGHQTGVTEPSRLTSDSICTADRRGGILISCGLKRTLDEAIKAPIRRAAGRSRRVRMGAGLNRTRSRCVVRIHPKRTYTLKPVVSSSARVRAGDETGACKSDPS